MSSLEVSMDITLGPNRPNWWKGESPLKKETGGDKVLPWLERLNMLSINPEAATISDIKRMASELSMLRHSVDLALRQAEIISNELQKIIGT